MKTSTTTTQVAVLVSYQIDSHSYCCGLFMQNANGLLLLLLLCRCFLRFLACTVASLCDSYVKALVHLKQPARGIVPMTAALRKMRKDEQTLTPQHGFLLQLCLLAKCYSAALPFVEKPIYDVDPKASGLTATHFLLYCYYG